MSNETSTTDRTPRVDTRSLVRLPHYLLGKWALIINVLVDGQCVVRFDDGREMLIAASAIVRTDDNA